LHGIDKRDFLIPKLKHVRLN